MRRRSRKRIYCYGRGTQIRPMLEPVLSSSNAVFSCFSGAPDCLDRLLTKPCDVLIVELEDSEAEGLDLLSQTRRMAPWISAMAIVENRAVPIAVKAIRAGACECLEKPLSAARLCEAVDGLLARTASLPRSHRALTQMEIQILQLILAGRTSQDIAVHLHRSKRTVDVHRKNIMRKVQASSLVDLIRRALSMGLTEEPGGDIVLETDGQ
ncbi:MAG: LuxR C-terminal-related transcriptional regulator [Phycisphaerales bacterium]